MDRQVYENIIELLRVNGKLDEHGNIHVCYLDENAEAVLQDYKDGDYDDCKTLEDFHEKICDGYDSDLDKKTIKDEILLNFGDIYEPKDLEEVVDEIFYGVPYIEEVAEFVEKYNLKFKEDK